MNVVKTIGRFGMSRYHKIGAGYQRRERLSYRARVEAMSPVAYWSCDQSAGTNIEEHISGADGTYVGATLGMAQFNALPVPYFDGINDYVSLPHAQLTALNGNPLAFSAWFWRANWNPGTQYVLLYTGYGATNNRWRLYYNSTASQMRFEWMVAGTPYVSYMSATLLSAGWHHFIGAITAAGSLNMYVDGEAQTGASGASLLTGISEAWVCSGTTPPSSPNAGYLSRYALFNRALSQDERASLGRFW